MPKGTPALKHFSAAARNVSNVQFLASSWLVGPSPGYIATTSMPACCFIRSRREHGPLICEPGVAGTAIQRPFWCARYSTTGLVLPLLARTSFITSSTGSRSSAWLLASQVRKVRMSWPECACDSAWMVSRSLLPWDGM